MIIKVWCNNMSDSSSRVRFASSFAPFCAATVKQRLVWNAQLLAVDVSVQIFRRFFEYAGGYLACVRDIEAGH